MRIRELIDLVESIDNRDRTFYHVTLSDNLPSIMDQGLLPTVGPRSKKVGEHAAVFLFPSEDDATDALGGWLGDQFDDDDEIAFSLIEVTLPDGIEAHKNDEVDWEYWVTESIPAHCLRIVKTNF